MHRFSSIQIVFNVHIQSKLLYHTPVMDSHSSYEGVYDSRLVVSSNPVRG